MKDCTGPRYLNEGQKLSMFDRWHGKFGHLNIAIRDHDSAVTGYGKHNRVVAFVPRNGELYCRVDRVWELRDPTHCEILRAAKDRNGSDQSGRFVFDRAEEYDDGRRVDYYFRRVQRS